MRGSVRRWLLLVGETLALVLGCLGVFLPLLPTTPFLLLSAACYLRSSPSRHAWLLDHKTLGPYISNYLMHRAIAPQARTAALSFLWLTLTVSAILVSRPAVRLLLAVVGIGVSIHLFCLRTITPGDIIANRCVDGSTEPPTEI